MKIQDFGCFKGKQSFSVGYTNHPGVSIMTHAEVSNEVLYECICRHIYKGCNCCGNGCKRKRKHIHGDSPLHFFLSEMRDKELSSEQFHIIIPKEKKPTIASLLYIAKILNLDIFIEWYEISK